MKRNLFVLHTQYNLILAVGLAQTKFLKDKNDLILFVDFPIKNDLISTCNDLFENVILLSGSYPKNNEKYINKIRRYPIIFNQINEFIINKYDRMFVVDDNCIPEMYCMKLAYRINKNIEFSWLEDGGIAYFDNNVKSGGLSSNFVTISIRKIIFKYFFMIGRFYDLSSYMGGHYLLSNAYVTYPNYVRPVYKEKQLIEINDNMFKVGLESIYEKVNFDIEDRSVIIILDKLNVYENIKVLEDSLKEIIKLYKNKGYEIFYKLHPREEQKISVFKGCIELDHGKSVESYYSTFLQKEISIIGVKSTGLQTAKKLGFQTFSLIRKVEPNEKEVTDFYNKIGVSLL